MDPNRVYDSSDDGPVEASAYKRGVYRSPPTRFSVEILTPRKQGNHFSYGMRIKSEGETGSLTSRRSSQSSSTSQLVYEVWRRWEDCLYLQEILEKEYAKLVREKKERLHDHLQERNSHSPRVGPYLPDGDNVSRSQRAASFTSLPMGPSLIATDLHEYIPKLARKGTFFRPSASTIQQRGKEFETLITALLRDDDEVPSLVIELREVRIIRDFFGYWRRDYDREMKERNKSKEETRRSSTLSPNSSKTRRPSSSSGIHQTSAVFGASAFGMYFAASNLSLQLPPPPASPLKDSSEADASDSNLDLGEDVQNKTVKAKPRNLVTSAQDDSADLPRDIPSQNFQYGKQGTSGFSSSSQVPTVKINNGNGGDTAYQSTQDSFLDSDSDFDDNKYPHPVVLSTDVETQEIPFGDPELEDISPGESQSSATQKIGYLTARNNDMFLDHDVRRLTIHEEVIDGDSYRSDTQPHDTLHLEISSFGGSSRSSRGTSLGASSISMSTAGTSIHQPDGHSLLSTPIKVDAYDDVSNDPTTTSTAQPADSTVPRVFNSLSFGLNSTPPTVVARRRTLSSGARHRARMSDIMPFETIRVNEVMGDILASRIYESPTNSPRTSGLLEQFQLQNTPKRGSIPSISSALSTSPSSSDPDTVAIKAILHSSTIVAFRTTRDITLQELRRKLHEKFVGQQSIPLSQSFSIGYEPKLNYVDQTRSLNGRIRSNSLSSVRTSNRMHLRYVTSQVQWGEMISASGPKLSLFLFD